MPTIQSKITETLTKYQHANLPVGHCRMLSCLQQDFGNPNKKGIKPAAVYRAASLTISNNLVEHQNHLKYRHVLEPVRLPLAHGKT
jgi:hypothetical protein